MRLARSTLGAAAALFVLPASAGLIQIGDITPAWVNPTPAGTPALSINNAGDPITARWGTPASGAGQSGYNFNDSDTPFMVDTDVDSGRFLLGTFTHINNPIFDSITSIGLSIGVSIPGGVPGAFSETFTLFHNETPNNTGTSPADDDIVTFSAGTTNAFFSLGGQNYYLRLFGFSIDGGATLLPQFRSREGGTNNAQLWAQIVAGRPTAVPEPGTLLLLGTGMLSLIALRRRRS